MFAIQNIQIVGCAVATEDHPRWDDGDPHYGIGGAIGLTPGGSRVVNGDFVNIGGYGFWWSSTDTSQTLASGRGSIYSLSSFPLYGSDKYYGFSVRAMRDATTLEKAYHDGEIIKDDYEDGDGNKYDGVKIGEQVWTTENLKTTKYQDTSAIDHITGNAAWEAATDGAYCWYDNDIGWKNIYGALYNWFAVNSGLVGGSWRVPSDADWTQLTDYIVREFGYMGFEAANVAVFLKSCRQVNHPKA